MKEYRLNCAGMTARKEFHHRIEELMEFPEWYGCNLDALYDVLTDICEDTLLIIEGGEQVQEQMVTYYPRILKVLKAAAKENPEFHFEVREEVKEGATEEVREESDREEASE